MKAELTENLSGEIDINNCQKFNKSISENILCDDGIDSDEAYRIVKDSLLSEGNARQNMVTFCQTYMEPQAVQLIAETLEKNAIDKSLYTQTADIENRCVDIVSNLWHRPLEEENKLSIPKGTSTIGSSEACMLGGLSMKYRWRKWAEEFKKNNQDFDINKKPNIVVCSHYQVCWEKFSKYWDVELRVVPIDKQHLTMNIDIMTDYIDEYTIGAVAILGNTYTGLYDDVEGMDRVLEEYNNSHINRFPVQIHVDGASGAFYEPFVDPDYLWDFRLKNVISINSSGHKYGLVYPGIGWIVWRSKEYLPKEYTFEVDYLGGIIRTASINFSKPAAHIIAQYYNFLRFGRSGYKKIHLATRKTAEYIENKIKKISINVNGKELPVFEIVKENNKLHRLPVVCWKLSDQLLNENLKWDLSDISECTAVNGWKIFGYPLSADLESVMVQRVVCRADMSLTLAEILVKDIEASVKKLSSDRDFRRNTYE